MAPVYRDQREFLRGAEEETFDLIAEALTSEEWAQLLKAPLERAAAKGNRLLAQKLMWAGAEIGNALHLAVCGGDQQIVVDVFRHGGSISAKDTSGHNPLHLAAQGGKPGMVQFLMTRGADKDSMGGSECTPLFMAVCGGHVAAALVLLAGNADVNLQCTPQKYPVLHIAALQGNVKILTAMIERGAEVDARDAQQHTALHHAAVQNQDEAIDVLIEAGANIEALNQTGSTPLHDAAEQPNREAVWVLLKHGADVNAQDHHRKTPLHLAARKAGRLGAADVVDSLLRSGADETVLSDEGDAAADVVGIDIGEGDAHAEANDARVRELLANASADRADRAWRRRGYLVLCRAHPDKVQLMQESSNAPTGVAGSTHSDAELTNVEASGCNDPVGDSTVNGGAIGDCAAVAATVLGLQEEGIFRAIVGYL